MGSFLRRTTTAGVATSGLLALTITTAGAAQAESPGAQPGEVLACVGDPAGCSAAYDAAGWAAGMAAALYPESPDLEDDAADAFRHCAWSAAITQRVGAERAERITTRHEYASEPSSMSAQVMDFGNNAIGRAVGARAQIEGGSDTWGSIIEQCHALGAADLLYGLGYDPSTRA